jgi:hypothetical protein
MAVMTNSYPNLPGHLVEFKDGGLALRTNTNATKTDSVLLLGTAVDGPVMEPVAIDMDTIETVFGKEVGSNGASNGSTLVKAAKELDKAGVTDIRCMRITGAVAEATIKKGNETITNDHNITDDFGLIPGNDKTVITLQHAPIVRGTTKVYAKGTLVQNGILVNETTGEVTISAGVCDAGASLAIQYDYYNTTVVAQEKHNVDADLKIALDYLPIGTVTLKVGGVQIAPADFTIAEKVISITQFAAGNPATEGTEVTADYTGITSDIFHATETGNGTTEFSAATSTLTKNLSQTPVSGTVHVYVDGVEMVKQGAFVVDATAKTIALAKEFFPMNALLSVSYSYNVTSIVEEDIKFRSYYGGAVYNKGAVGVSEIKTSDNTVIGKLITITKPAEKKSQVAEVALTYSSMVYTTFGQLVEAINADSNNGVYKAFTDYPDALVQDISINTSVSNTIGANFIGGDDGIVITKATLFNALSGVRDAEGYLIVQGAYQLLEDYQVDWIVPLGVYANDELPGRYQNFAYELGLFCTTLSYRNKITLGAIDVKPCTDTSLAGIQDYANKLANMDNTYLMKDNVGNLIAGNDGSPIDLGCFMTVVAGPDPIYFTKLGRYSGSPAVAYVGLNAVLMSQSAPTNKKLTGTQGLRYRFSNMQHNAILGNRLVTFKTKFDANGATSGEAYCVDGITAALRTSDYTRLTTAKVIRETINHVREVAEPFIGEPNTPEQRNALSSAISKRLGLLKEKGVITDYQFVVSSTIQQQVLGEAKIELTIVPPQELRKITTIVGLKAA